MVDLLLSPAQTPWRRRRDLLRLGGFFSVVAREEEDRGEERRKEEAAADGEGGELGLGRRPWPRLYSWKGEEVAWEGRRRGREGDSDVDRSVLE